MLLAPEFVGYIEVEHEGFEECWCAPCSLVEAAEGDGSSVGERDDVSVVVVAADLSALRADLDREWLLLWRKARAMLQASPLDGA